MVRLPYPGLRAFRNDETDLFFGREGVVDTLVDRLGATRFLAVLGASGSGKSSVVRTGLIDALEMGFLTSAGSRWRILDFSPGGRPHRNLACVLAGPDADDMEIELVESFLHRGPRSLVEWCENGNLAKGTNLLVLVDQFEELFRYRDYAGRESAEAFVALILESSRAESVPIFVTLTMRSEYLGACTLIDGLAEAINRGQYLTPRLTREETRRAIIGPAGVCEFTVSSGLVTRLLNDLDGFAPWEEGEEVDQLDRLVRRADQLPLLQHALNRMFTLALSEPGGRDPLVLTVADYERIGGLKGTLDGQAAEILAELGPHRLPVVEIVFRALTTGTTIADAVRRPSPLRELVEVAGGGRDDVLAVVNAFSAHGRNLLQAKTSGEIDDHTVIDISHESLIRQWTRLSEWLRKEADAASAWRRLQEASALYASGRGNLLEDLNLANVAEWWDRELPSKAWAARYGGRYDEVSSFLTASREYDRAKRERQAALEREAQEAKLRESEHQRALEAERAASARRLSQRTMVIASLLAVVALIAMGLGWFAFDRWGEAQASAVTAMEQTRTAEDALAAAAAAAAAADEAREEAERLRLEADDARAEADSRLEEAQIAASRFRIREAAVLMDSIVGESTSAVQLMRRPLLLVLQSVPTPERPDWPVVEGGEDLLRRIVERIESVRGGGDTEQLLGVLSPPGVSASHSGEVNGAAISPDGALVASASEDGTVRLWSTETGETVRVLNDGYAVSAVAFSPDGTLLLTGSAENVAKLWDVESGTELVRFAGHGGRVRTVAWSPDGTMVATGGDDATARVWATDGTLLSTMEGHSDWVRAVAFSPDGALVATASDDMTVRLWSVLTGDETLLLQGHTDWVRSVAFSPDGSRLASAGDDGTIRGWSVSSGSQMFFINAAPEHYIFSVAYSPDGQYLASGATDNLVRLWSAATGGLVADLAGHTSTVYGVAFSADSASIVSASADFTVREWSVVERAEELVFGGRLSDVAAMAFDRTGERLVTGSSDGSVRLWSVQDAAIASIIEGSASVLAVAVAPGSGIVAAASNDNTVRLYSPEGEFLREFAHADWVRGIAFSPDGTTLATGADDNIARLWDVATGTLVREMPGHRDWIRSVAFSPDGTMLLTGSDDGTARLWSVETGDEIRSFSGHDGYVYSVAFSPDGRLIATGGDDFQIIVWAAGSGEQLQTMVEEGVVYSLAFSPQDGSDLLAVAGENARVWAAESGTVVQRLEADNSTVYAAAYAPAGEAIAIGGSDGVTRMYRVFRILPDEVLARARQIIEEEKFGSLDTRERCEFMLATEDDTCTLETPEGNPAAAPSTERPPGQSDGSREPVAEPTEDASALAP